MSGIATDRDLRLSVRPGTHGGIAETVRRAQAAEAAGFDQVWFGNDIFGPSGVVTLSAIAVGTSRIMLGSARGPIPIDGS